MRTKLLALLLFFSGLAFGQTTVNVTVTDSDAQTWNNGTYAVQLVNSPGQPQGPWKLNGSPVSAVQLTGGISASGTFSIGLNANVNLAPAGSVYNFTVCAQAVPTPCLTQQVTVSTSSPQTVNMSPSAIRINLGTPPFPAYVAAYADQEVINALPGQQYFNLVSSAARQWNGVAWGPFVGGTAAGGTANQVQYNNAGALAGTGPGVLGQVLVSQGAAAPSFSSSMGPTINGDLWVGSGVGQYTSIGACLTAASAGQSCHLTAGGSETLSANITLKNQVCIIPHGLYTITMGAFNVVGPAGVPPCIKSLGLATSTSAGPGANLVLTGYTGTGAVLDIGTASADTRGGDLEGIFISLTNAGAAAVGVRERRLQAAYHNNVVVQGGGTNAATEIGYLLDGTGTFTGNNLYDNCTSNGTLVSMRFLSSANLNKINGGNWSTSVASGIGMDFQGAEGNLIEAIDLESTATAFNFANSASVSNNVCWDCFFQNNTTDVVFGAASKANIVHNAQAGAMTVTDNSAAGNWNSVIGPAPGFRFNKNGQLALAAGAANAPSIVLPNGLGIHQTATTSILGVSDSSFNWFSFGSGPLGLRSNAWIKWVSTGDSDATQDTGLARGAAGVVTVDTSAAGNALGTLKPAAILSGGTAATLTGTGACATLSTQTGGSMVGRATCTGTTAASTLTITPGTTAPNGWVCVVQDQTTRANLFQQTSNTTTACTLTATSVTQNDVVVFTALAF